MLSPSIMKNNVLQEVLVIIMYLLIKKHINNHIKAWTGFWLNTIKFYSSFPKVQAKFQSGEEKEKKKKHLPQQPIQLLIKLVLFQSYFHFW